MGLLFFDDIVNKQVETSVDQAVENHKIEIEPFNQKKKKRCSLGQVFFRHSTEPKLTFLNTLFLFYITEDSKRNFQQYVNKD